MDNLSTFTPELSTVIRANIDSVLMDANFCLPGKITAYDPDTQYADVEVQLLQKFTDGSLIPFPVIPHVPVKQLRSNGGKTFIHMPLVIGDDVILVFSQRSLDNWKTSGGMTDPDDPRKFNITDAFALIGGSAIPDAFTPSTDDSIEIVNGESSLIISPDGTFNIKNSNQDLISNLITLVNTLIASSTVVGGPFVPSTITQLQQTLANLQTLEGS